MSRVAHGALNAYSQASLDAKVAAASPHGLITMLFDGALAAISKAKFNIGAGTVEGVAEKGKAISHAISIIDEGLKAGLNLEVGGELAENLYALYEYMSHRLIQANLNNDVAALEEVSLRLKELRDAWDSIGVEPEVRGMVRDERTMNASGTVTYGRV